MQTHIGDALEPNPQCRVERGEIGQVQAIEEIVFHITDTTLDASLLVSFGDSTSHNLKAVMAGEIDITRIELRRLTPGMAQYRTAQIVDHDFIRDTQCIEGIDVRRQKLFHGLRQRKFDIHLPAVRQHHHKEGEAPAGIANGNRAVLTPIDLCHIAWCEGQGEKRFASARPDRPDILFDDTDATPEAVILQALEDLLGG